MKNKTIITIAVLFALSGIGIVDGMQNYGENQIEFHPDSIGGTYTVISPYPKLSNCPGFVSVEAATTMIKTYYYYVSVGNTTLGDSPGWCGNPVPITPPAPQPAPGTLAENYRGFQVYYGESGTFYVTGQGLVATGLASIIVAERAVNVYWYNGMW